MYGRKIARVLAVPVAGIFFFVAPVESANAISCIGGLHGHFFNGYFQSGHPEHQYEGASSYIVVQDGTNCGSGTDDFVNSWVMIASNGGSGL